MTLTTYGYRMPESGDKAKGTSGWFASYEFNVTRWDGHNHDGANSALLTFASISPFTGTILAANWVVDGAGYKQTITVPAGVTEINNYNVKFIASAGTAPVGTTLYLGYKRVTATTYEVYCNDVTTACTALYR